jgi:GDP-4-dehydro-6-deoxy-D-mannose reductase
MPQGDAPRILVTGVTGFAGGYLAEALLARGGAEVFGVNRHAGWPPELAHLAGRVVLRGCDLTDRDAAEAVLRDVCPQQIYHLAGYAQVGRSFDEADAAWAGNLTATRTLCDAVVRWGGRPRILFVGSGLIYGSPDSPDAAQHEDTPLRPNSPYAASKAAADLAGYQYSCHPGLDIVRARPFNHIGPRQSAQFAAANFARQVAAVRGGQAPPVLETGDLTPRRDLSDVRDVIAAYMLLMEKGRRGEAYNIASGQVVSMREVLDRLIALAGVAVEVRQRGDLLRATELTVVRVDTSKLRRETGWAPRFTLDETLAELLAFWQHA